MSTIVYNKQNQSTRRQDDWTNIKTQEYKSKKQTLWHRNTGVQNRQTQRGTRGENKQKDNYIRVQSKLQGAAVKNQVTVRQKL